MALTETPEGERLQKLLARCGVASRRACETLIAEGHVEVDGELVLEPGFRVLPASKVTVDGRRVREPKLEYLLLHKPKGYLTTMSDPQGRRTVAALLAQHGAGGLKPAGRLDMDTSGLLLCTNDGDLAARLTHPRHEVEKEYVALVRGLVTPRDLQRLRQGIFLAPERPTEKGRRTSPAKVVIVHQDAARGLTTLRLVLHEGLNRQVRRMCQAVGHPVRELERTRVGFLTLKGVAVGGARRLTKAEVERLKRLTELEVKAQRGRRVRDRADRDNR